MKKKLDDQDFVSLCEKYDCLCFSETWLKPNENCTLKGFDAFHVLGRKGKRKKGRFSGGVSFYFKHDLKKGIKCLKNCQFNGLHALWVKFDKHFFSY